MRRMSSWVLLVLCLGTMPMSVEATSCGDGIIDPGETCDPPDPTPVPGVVPPQPVCRLDCTRCGDGIVDASADEVCDAGTNVCGMCTSGCVPPILDAGGHLCTCGMAHPQLVAIRAEISTACPCDASASHGDFVRCARAILEGATATGRLLPGCEKAILKCEAKSICGRPGAVTCCRTSAKGIGKCLVKRDLTHCKAPVGGTVVLGASATCCDACP
jgi:hypothetical protein